VRRVPFFDADALLEMDRQAMGLLHGEMAGVHADWYRRYQARYRPRTARGVLRGQAVSEHDLAAFRVGRLTFRARITTLMHTAGVDLWITPASAGPAPAGLELTGWGGMTTAWSYAGLPCVAVPAGRASTGLPLGLQCVGGFGQDEALLSWAEEVASVLSDPGGHVPTPRADIPPVRVNSSS
jgi:Asp-tRNA(Asn)/Glu-tRNA(Gln) amidotransferase A subunit family amidase